MGIGFGACDIIGERASTDNVCLASYDLRCASCSSNIRYASSAYDLNYVDASANLHGTSSAYALCGSDDVCCASDDLRSTCGSDDICCASCAYDHINVGSTHDLHSACGYIGFGAGDIIGERT